MPTETRTMKLSKTNESELTALADILNDLEALHKSNYELYIDDLDLSEYNTLCLFKGSTPEQFIEFICEQVSNIHFQRIIMNTSVLLENCADPSLSHVDFTPDIKRGLELVELEKAGKLTIKED